MTIDYQRIPHQGIQTLSPYKPGKSIDELAKEKGLTDIIKMASNENPLGCSPKVREALANMSATTIAAYPAPAHHPLLNKLADRLAIAPGQIILSNGTDLIFFFLLTAFGLYHKKKVVTHKQAFISYAIQAQTLGLDVNEVPLKDNFELDIDAMISATQNEQASLLFLANPNNPTGILTPHQDILRLLNSVPKSTLVVLDEAYHEYACGLDDNTTRLLLDDHPNLVLTRTFSKLYGMAGLRLGYAMASPDIISILQRIQPPFMVNRASLDAANAALDDHDFIKQSLETNTRGRQQLLNGFKELGIDSIPSQTNFITFDCKKESLPIYEQLLASGIIVRPLHPYGLNQHLRVSIGTEQQNQRFLDALAVILNPKTNRL